MNRTFLKNKSLYYSILLLVYTFFSITSCKDQVVGSEISSTKTTRVVVDTDADKSTALSDLVKEVQYISLEETDASLIGDIAKIIVTNDRFLIQDDFSEKIFIYSKSGKHLFTLNRKGGGPGEYENLNQIGYDFEKNQIVVTSNSKILWFDEDGNFVRELRSIFAGAQGFQVLEDSWLAFFMAYTHLDQSQDPHNLCILDENGRLIRRHLPLENVKTKNTISLFNFFDHQRNTGLLSQQYSNDLISVQKAGTYVRYRLDFGENNLPVDFAQKYLSDGALNYQQIFEEEKENKWAHLKGISALETSEFLNFSYAYEGKYVFGIYNKITSKMQQYDASIANDIGGLETLYNYTTSDDYFVSLTYHGDLIASVDEKRVIEPSLVEQIRALPKNENPVLRLVKFK